MIILIIFLAIIFFATILLICFSCYQQGKSVGYDEMSAIYKNSQVADKENIRLTEEAAKSWEIGSANWKKAAEHWENAYNLLKENNDTR